MQTYTPSKLPNSGERERKKKEEKKEEEKRGKPRTLNPEP